MGGAVRAPARLTRHEAEVLDGLRRRDARHHGGALFCSRRPRLEVDRALRRRRPLYGVGCPSTLVSLAAKGYLVLEGEVGAVALFSLAPGRCNPHRVGA